MRRLFLLTVTLLGCGAPPMSTPSAPEPMSDAGIDAGFWTTRAVPGTRCASGAPAAIGYSAGATDELHVFMQGGGACWNNGTCAASLNQWGPVCNYASNAPCLWDNPGGTKPLAVYVDWPDPFPADGGGAWDREFWPLRDNVLFSRHPQNPFRTATAAFIPYCTGDLHAGQAERTWLVKNQLFDPPQPRVHQFAGAGNTDAYIAWLRARHPNVRVLWLTGISGGGYGVQLNLQRFRAAFPEAQVHALADSAPMVEGIHEPAWRSAWNLQLPLACPSCDGGFPSILAHQLASAPSSRIALLSFAEDETITRFFYAGGDTNSWLTPNTAAYVQRLAGVESLYVKSSNARYFRLPGRDHVMLKYAGDVLADGGVSDSPRTGDGGTLKQWIDAWALGDAGWENRP